MSKTSSRCEMFVDNHEFYGFCTALGAHIEHTFNRRLFSQSELNAAVAQARLEEHDATCEECKMHLDLKDSATVTDTDFCPRHVDLESLLTGALLLGAKPRVFTPHVY